MKPLPVRLIKFLLLTLCLGLAACNKAPEQAKKAPAPTLVSTTAAQTTRMEVREEAVGTIEGLIDPTVAAEVARLIVSGGSLIVIAEGDVIGADVEPGKRIAGVGALESEHPLCWHG